jgi:hypothetical protein
VPDFGLETTKDISIVIAGLIALVTFVTGTVEYRRRGRHERAETFVQMRRRFQESPVFKSLLDLLSRNDPAVRDVSVQDRRNLVGFLEEIGLMVNSGLLRIEVARLMFGVYVDLVNNCEGFWDGLDRESEDWTMFRRFTDRLRKVGKNPPAPDSRLRF